MQRTRRLRCRERRRQRQQRGKRHRTQLAEHLGHRLEVAQASLDTLAELVDGVDAATRLEEGNVLEVDDDTGDRLTPVEMRRHARDDAGSGRGPRRVCRSLDARERGGDLDLEICHPEGFDDIAGRAAIQRLPRNGEIGETGEDHRRGLRPFTTELVEQGHARRPRQRDVDEHEVVELSVQRSRRLGDVVGGVTDRDCFERARGDETDLLVVVDDQDARPAHVGACSIAAGSNATFSARMSSGVVNGLRSRCTPTSSSSCTAPGV